MFRLFSILLVLTFASKVSASPIMIFMGGFGSCSVAGKTSEIKSTSLINRLMEDAHNTYGDDIVEVRTCYALGSEPIFVSAPKLGLDSVRMTRDELAQTIRDAASSSDDSPVYVWGQSHGGWTAMDLVRRVPNLQYQVLTTVDPISIPDCGPVVFVGGVLLGTAPGCRGAPQDLGSSFEQISKSVAHWTNWYQLEFPLLHSDNIAHATENVERSFNASWWIPMGAHHLMETDPVMWQKTTVRIVNDLKKRASNHN